MELLLFPSIPILICTLISLLIFIGKGFIKSKSRYPRPPPGPWKLPIIGSMHHLAGQLPFRAFHDLSIRYGPLMLLRIGQVNFTVVSSAEAAKEILKNQDPNFALRPELAIGKVVCYGFSDIFFSPYGPYWKQLRRLCYMELLNTKRIRSFSSIRKEETLNLMRDIATTKTPINMSQKLFQLSNAILTRAAFGKRSENPERLIPVAKEAFELLSGFCVADTFPSMKFLAILTGIKVQRLHRQLDKILGDIIKDHEVKAMISNGRQADEVEDLVDVLLRLKDEPELEVPMTTDNVKAVIFDMFLGGSETSSNVVEWAMSELMMNSKIMEKAQKEVREALEGKTRIEESDLVELNYIKLIIKETLRLHPPAPLIPRICKETCEVVGYEIEAGTRIFVNAWAINRDPRHWDDSESFKPERFDGNSIDFKGANFDYLPFGAGRRICPGISFGLATVELTLTQLLLYFDWKLPDGMKPGELDMSETFGLVAARKTELKLLATPHIPIPVSA